MGKKHVTFRLSSVALGIIEEGVKSGFSKTDLVERGLVLFHQDLLNKPKQVTQKKEQVTQKTD